MRYASAHASPSQSQTHWRSLYAQKEISCLSPHNNGTMHSTTSLRAGPEGYMCASHSVTPRFEVCPPGCAACHFLLCENSMLVRLWRDFFPERDHGILATVWIPRRC